MTKHLSKADLAAIRARVDAATAGPFHSADSAVFAPLGRLLFCVARTQDARFLADARTDVPALLDEVERLREAMRAAATVLKDEGAGCYECIGEYGRGGYSVALDLEEALGD